jgi:hypothetical protein
MPQKTAKTNEEDLQRQDRNVCTDNINVVNEKAAKT